MTLAQLRDLVAVTSAEPGDLEVKVWLPGTRITLVGMGMARDPRNHNALLIEGSVDEGGAL